jgi:hypothetical protein
MDVADGAVGAWGSFKDFDGDGIPNHSDDDDDGDGIPDSEENPHQGDFTGEDKDADGIDDGVDYDVNGTITGTDNDSNGVQDDKEMADEDGDGIADHFDKDADNDGVDDSTDVSVNTGNDVKTSTGAGSADLFLLAMLLTLFAFSKRKRLMFLAMLMITGQAQAQAGDLQLGFGVGQAKLDPDLIPGLAVSDDTDTHVLVDLGYVLTDEFSLHGRMMDFGKVRLGRGSIDYNGRALLLEYAPGKLSMASWKPYALIGMSYIRTYGLGGINIEDPNGYESSVAVGVKYPLDDKAQLVFEMASYAKDVQAFTIQLRCSLE